MTETRETVKTSIIIDTVESERIARAKHLIALREFLMKRHDEVENYISLLIHRAYFEQEPFRKELAFDTCKNLSLTLMKNDPSCRCEISRRLADVRRCFEWIEEESQKRIVSPDEKSIQGKDTGRTHAPEHKEIELFFQSSELIIMSL